MKFNKTDFIYLGILLILSFVFLFLALGSYTLLDVDEPRYAEAAREMIESNNWITPYFNYEVRFAKPVLFYWMIAGSYKVFGLSEFAARFPSALMATIIVFAVFFFGRRHINSKFGLIASLITLTSLEFIALARMSITDMTLSAFISLMLMSGFTAIHSNEPHKKYFWYAFYICMALGTLTKGPIVPAFAVIIFLPYLLLTGKFVEVFKSCRLISGSLLYLLLVVPWYALIIMENGQAYIDQFFLTDNLKRFTGTVSGHKGPVYFFFIVVLVGFIPWSFYLPCALYKYIKPIIDAFKIKRTTQRNNNNIFHKAYDICLTPIVSKYKVLPVKDHLSLFILLWFIIIFCFFSLSGTKLLTYILPLFPALGLIVGHLWYDYINNRETSFHKSMFISSGILMVVVSILSYVMIFHFNTLMPRDAKVLDIGTVTLYASLLLFSGTLFNFIFTKYIKKEFAFYSIITTMVLLVIVGLYGVIPKVNHAAQGHLNELIQIINNQEDKDNILLTCGMIKPSIVFYTKRAIKHLEVDHYEDLVKYFQNPKRVFIITRERHLETLAEKHNFYKINVGRRFALITNKPLSKDLKNKMNMELQ